jgi:hypothetical protein
VAAIRYTDEQLAILGNEIVADIDNDYKTHKERLITHFLVAWDKGEVHWPKQLKEQKDERYRCYRLKRYNSL